MIHASKRAAGAVLPAFVVLLAASIAAFAQSPADAPLAPKPYRFDAGPDSQIAIDGILPLTTSTEFMASSGYGWTVAPDSAFVRERLLTPRSQRLFDGVSGSEIGFAASVPAGRWWVTAWIEAGVEDSTTLTVSLNGADFRPDWQSFDPPSEPRSQIQSIYRVFHRPVDVGQDGLRLHLTGRNDLVRLLALSLHPDPVPQKVLHGQLLRRLGEMGNWDALAYDPESDLSVFDTIWRATDTLQSLQTKLQVLEQESPGDVFASYWSEQLDILILAERYFAMRGWERFKKETRLGLFDRLHHVVMLLDGILDRPDVESHPLRDRAMFTRGRVLYWLALERGGDHEMASGLSDLASLYERFPDDPLLAMYNGEYISSESECDSLEMSEAAPEWSRVQFESLCRMSHIARWWTEKQQIANGEFGGKLGDDVELLRWWPSLMVAGEASAMKGWRRLADGVWESDETRDGYAAQVSDVEHSSEFISDTAPFLAFASNDPKYIDRLRPSGRYFQNLWTGFSDHGRRFFKSAWFSSTEVDMEPPKNRDLDYNTRATKAVRYLAWLTGDDSLKTSLKEWSDAWVSAAMRTDKGKPAGLIPPSVRFPDEAINGDGPDWYDADMYWNYFNWTHSAGSKLMDQLLFSYTQTGDESLLQPMFAALDLVSAYEFQEERRRTAPRGTPAWAADVLLGKRAFWGVAAQWRLQSDDRKYDELLLRHGPPYLRYRLTGDASAMITSLRRMNESIRHNEPLRTYEAIHTDRVYLSRGGWSGDSQLLAMLTGNGIFEEASPYFAVSWGGGDGFTALLNDSSPTSVDADVFIHRDSGAWAKIDLRVWQLEPGRYRLSIQRGDQTPEVSEVVIDRPGQSVPVLVPANTLASIRMKAS